MSTQTRSSLARAALVTVAAVALSACASTGGAPWTYAPLGPTPSGGVLPSPAGTPTGQLIDVVTNQNDPLGYVPNPIEAPANTLVSVVYTNNSTLEHNIEFFNGSDQNAPPLGKTERVTGPNATRFTTFTTPTAAGDYFFWCIVHTTTMVGTLHVE